MQTEARPIGGLDINPTGFLSLAMTALRLSVPKEKVPCMRDEYITLDEVSYHDNEKDCWVVIYDRVYDLTNFFYEVNIGIVFVI